MVVTWSDLHPYLHFNKHKSRNNSADSVVVDKNLIIKNFFCWGKVWLLASTHLRCHSFIDLAVLELKVLLMVIVMPAYARHCIAVKFIQILSCIKHGSRYSKGGWCQQPSYVVHVGFCALCWLADRPTGRLTCAGPVWAALMFCTSPKQQQTMNEHRVLFTIINNQQSLYISCVVNYFFMKPYLIFQQFCA